MVNFVFHLKSDEGHIERFSFDVYMSPLPIFTKIKHPFAWHISFLIRHLRKYSEVWLSIKVIWVLKHICWRAFSLKHNVSTGFFVLTRITSHSRFFGQILSRYISRSTWFMFFTEEWWMFFHKDTHFFLAHNLAIFFKTQVVMKWRWEQKGPKMKQINESQGGISRTCCL